MALNCITMICIPLKTLPCITIHLALPLRNVPLSSTLWLKRKHLDIDLVNDMDERGQDRKSETSFITGPAKIVRYQFP